MPALLPLLNAWATAYILRYSSNGSLEGSGKMTVTSWMSLMVVAVLRDSATMFLLDAILARESLWCTGSVFTGSRLSTSTSSLSSKASNTLLDTFIGKDWPAPLELSVAPRRSGLRVFSEEEMSTDKLRIFKDKKSVDGPKLWGCCDDFVSLNDVTLGSKTLALTLK